VKMNIEEEIRELKRRMWWAEDGLSDLRDEHMPEPVCFCDDCERERDEYWARRRKLYVEAHGQDMSEEYWHMRRHEHEGNRA